MDEGMLPNDGICVNSTALKIEYSVPRVVLWLIYKSEREAKNVPVQILLTFHHGHIIEDGAGGDSNL